MQHVALRTETGGSVVRGKERRGGFREEFKSLTQWWVLVQTPLEAPDSRLPVKANVRDIQSGRGNWTPAVFLKGYLST